MHVHIDSQATSHSTSDHRTDSAGPMTAVAGTKKRSARSVDTDSPPLLATTARCKSCPCLPFSPESECKAAESEGVKSLKDKFAELQLTCISMTGVGSRVCDQR